LQSERIVVIPQPQQPQPPLSERIVVVPQRPPPIRRNIQERERP
jgi:hypothetical protein